jgi:hypothetical protein
LTTTTTCHDYFGPNENSAFFLSLGKQGHLFGLFPWWLLPRRRVGAVVNRQADQGQAEASFLLRVVLATF